MSSGEAPDPGAIAEDDFDGEMTFEAFWNSEEEEALSDRLRAMPRESFRGLLTRWAELHDSTIDELTAETGAAGVELSDVDGDILDRAWQDTLPVAEDLQALGKLDPSVRVATLSGLLDLGFSIGRDDWFDPSTVFLLDAAGVDEDLYWNCRLRDFMQIVVGDQAPAISADALRRAAGRGFELAVANGSRFDLASLIELLPLFKGVDLGYGTYTGWRALESCRSLKGIRLAVEPDIPIDLSGLPDLAEAFVVGSNALSVAGNSSLRRLRIGDAALPADFRVLAPLTELSVSATNTPPNLDFLAHAEDLTTLRIVGAASFDVASLAMSPSLETVEFDRCRELKNIETLRELPALRTLEISGCRNAPGYEVIAELPLERFVAEEHHVFDAAFEERVAALPGSWSVSPKKRPPAKRVSDSTRAVFDDGIDALSFAPFELHEPFEDGGYSLVFTDWDAVDERFGESIAGLHLSGHGMAGIVREAVRDEAPELLESIEFDPEGDGLYAYVDSLERLEQVARIASRAWSSVARMRRYARRAAEAEAAEAAAEAPGSE